VSLYGARTINPAGANTIAGAFNIGDGTLATVFDSNTKAVVVQGITTVFNASTLKANGVAALTFGDLVINSGGLAQGSGKHYDRDIKRQVSQTTER